MGNKVSKNKALEAKKSNEEIQGRDNSFFREARGYVDRDFRVFHLTDSPTEDIPLHFHNFRKVVILVKGHIGYVVEGVSYELRAGDIVLVDKGELHRPVFHDEKEYERIIIYLSDEFFGGSWLGESDREEAFLRKCFDEAGGGGRHVISGKKVKQELVSELAFGMTDEVCRESAEGLFLQKLRVMEFLVRLNDYYVSDQISGKDEQGEAINETVLQVMNYISANLSENLSIERLAEETHLSRYYLMHMFKNETGYTLKEFITDKRLIAADRLMSEGKPLTEVCFECGFTSYSGFYRAFIDKYGYSPKRYKMN